MKKKLYLCIMGAALFSASALFIESDNFITSAQTKKSGDITSNKNPQLNVTSEFWKQQNDLALEKRSAPTGDKPRGLIVPNELKNSNPAKQIAKFREMVENGFEKPFDYTDLAQKRMNGELIELPVATENFVIDVGGQATDEEFTWFDFENGSITLDAESSNYKILKKLADDFDGMKYDLNNPQDRRSMKIRLLRMVHPSVKPVLEEIANAYQQKFKRPLRVTSLVRTMEYQKNLSEVDAGAFLVRDADALPPHVSGCAVDISRRYLTAEEQNFIANKLAEMKKKEKIDGTIEYGTSPVFHFFVYADGKAPKLKTNSKEK